MGSAGLFCFKLLFAFGLCFYTSCSRTNSVTGDESNVTTVTIAEIPQQAIDLSEYVDSLKQVILQVPNDIVIGTVSQLILDNDFIAALDVQTKSIHFFNYDGEYIRTIRRFGRGPGEYLSISKILFDADSRNLMVYDNEQRNMLVYDLSGDHIKTIYNFADRAPLRDIINLPSGGFLCSRFDRTEETTKAEYVGLWITDADGIFQKYLLHDEVVYPIRFVQCPYYLYNHPGTGIGYIDPNTYDIFQLVRDTLYKKIAYKFPQKKTIQDFKGERKTDASYLMPFISQHKGGYIFTSWIDYANKGFVSVFSIPDHELLTGVVFSGLIDGQLATSGVFIPNNSKNVLTSYLPATMLVDILENNGMPDEFKLAVRNIVGERTQEEIMDMGPIITSLYIKNNQ